MGVNVLVQIWTGQTKDAPTKLDTSGPVHTDQYIKLHMFNLP